MPEASSATVGASSSSRSGSSIAKVARRRAAMRAAVSECPPSRKKSSWTPTRPSPSASCQIVAISRSVAVRGGA
jgi:hypothetical protein